MAIGDRPGALLAQQVARTQRANSCPGGAQAVGSNRSKLADSWRSVCKTRTQRATTLRSAVRHLCAYSRSKTLFLHCISRAPSLNASAVFIRLSAFWRSVCRSNCITTLSAVVVVHWSRRCRSAFASSCPCRIASLLACS
jgi:hypothetical protein